MIRLILSSLFLLLSASGVIIAQSSSEKFFLRHSMIFFEGEAPSISPSEILFTKQSICGFATEPYNSPILRRGDEINVMSIDRTKNPGVVVFRNEKSEFKVELANASKRVFTESFDLAFSRKKEDFGWGGATKWSTVIRKFGYPVAKCQNDGGWFYFLEFSPNACGSFDGCVLKVTSKGLKRSYGYT